MSVSDETFKEWFELIKTVKPLSKAEKQQSDVPPRLRVYGAPMRLLQNTLDLHGLTVQEAYNTVRRFFCLHHQAQTKIISIITGKGIQGTGLIKKEILFWLETPFFKDKVHSFKWINEGGTLEIQLKRKKRK